MLWGRFADARPLGRLPIRPFGGHVDGGKVAAFVAVDFPSVEDVGCTRRSALIRHLWFRLRRSDHRDAGFFDAGVKRGRISITSG
jgi:hypothetical protein